MRPNLIALALVIATAAPVIFLTSPAAYAQAASPEGTFTKVSKALSGGWSVVKRDGKSFIVFDDTFRAANGPDLKVFLSPQSMSQVTGKTAATGAVNVGVLKKTKGTQEYEIPVGTDLSKFKSVLVHCEEFAVLWGGSDL
ncbi:MAG: hypothetical protein CVT79_18235 [Alphaproteobacteria bacterium HGW-Alphaproteobacteria-18]|nr:MAG: hypothetical protein CVT79_18235 [Alphaproteobacteria bacterium HGW-Alphaproteobacteria-18]